MKGLILLILCVFTQTAFAQNLDMVDLGNLVGEMERFEGTLSWTNSGQDTVKVRPWTDRDALTFEDRVVAVAPGNEATFAYALNLTDTKGQQRYEARLVTEEEVVIHGWLLKTRVFEAEQDVFKEYLHEFYPFRSRSMVMNLKAAFQGDEMNGSFSLFNFGGQELDLSGAYVNQENVTLSFGPEKIGHNAFTRLSIELNTQDEALGFTRENLSVYTADSSLLFTMPLQYTLEKRPESSLVGQVPHLTVSKLTHDFKVVEKGTQEQVDIRLTNTGHAPLLIEKLEANCDCLAFELGQKELTTGQSVILKVTFDARERMGYERKTLALFTNDPDQPTRVITFKAHVK